MSSISLQSLTMRRGDLLAVDDLSLEVRPGEFLTMLGPSGCGKTTTLRCIAGLERPTAGEIRIGDRVVTSTTKKTFVGPERRSIGMVFQSYALWPHLSVFENVAYPLRRQRTSGSELGGRVEAALDLVGLRPLAHRSIGALSGGQQQRIALARAVVGEPQVLLFDEPLSNLDAKLRAGMRDQLRILHDRLGTTSIYVTHDQLEAATLSDRIVVMADGRARQVGTPDDIYARPAERFIAEFIGYENLLPGRVERVGETVHVLLGGLDVVLEAAGSRPDALAVGDSVLAAFRANAVSVLDEDPGTPAANVVRSVVETAVFMGDQTELRLRAGLVARAPGLMDQRSSGEVAARIDPQRIALVSG